MQTTRKEKKLVLEISTSEQLKLSCDFDRESLESKWGLAPGIRVVFHRISNWKFSHGFVNSSSIFI